MSVQEVLKPLYAKLKKAGVPEERWPSHEHIISKLIGWSNDEKVDDWVEKYAALEGK